MREEVVELVRTLCGSAARLGNSYESVAALDSTEAAPEAALGISPMVVATPPERLRSPNELISNLRIISIGARDDRTRRAPQASTGAVKARNPAQQCKLGSKMARVRRVEILHHFARSMPKVYLSD